MTILAYDYNDKLDLFDDKFTYNVVKNVPCYNVKDLAKILNRKPGDTSLNFGRFVLNADTIAIETSNNRGKTHYYVIATEQVRELVRLNTAFAMLKGHADKAPKLHHKCIYIHLVNKMMSKDCKTTLRYRPAYITDAWQFVESVKA